MATKDFDGALDLLRAVGKDLSGTLHSFEAMWPAFQKFATEACKLSSPLEIDGTLWLLLEVECDPQAFTDFLEKVFEEGLLLQASVAESEQQRQRFWALREIPVDFPRKLPGLIGFDVGIPRAQMSAALKDMEDVLQSRWPEITSLSYGHVADGNLHLVVHVPNVERQPEEEIHDLVYEIVQKYGGAISAEHGVGQNKKPWLHMSRTPQEIALMQSVKKALDPRGILNPGRIFG